MRIANKDPKNEIIFIADIGANHDGNLKRAKELIKLCKEAGADVAKFQHFKAETIVSKQQFDRDNNNWKTHQSNWKKSVFEVYEEASVNSDWNQQLKECCEQCDIEFMTTPYSPLIVDEIDPYVSAYKVGSGDITWHANIESMALKKKPLLLATGASNMDEVIAAVRIIETIHENYVLMQCNTNYTGSIENFKYINLRVLDAYSKIFPGKVLGLSDHTPGHETVLGAIAKGATVIEKHFTDDTTRSGPDHKFAMDPTTWKGMVKSSNLLLSALGDGTKRVEENERDTVIVQRRSIKAVRNLNAGHTLRETDFAFLRPCLPDGVAPYEMHKLLGKKLTKKIEKGLEIKFSDVS